MTFLAHNELRDRLPRWLRDVGCGSGMDVSLSSAALLILDMQNDFMEGGRLPCWGGPAVIPNIARLAAAFRRHAWPVVYTRHVCLAPTGKSPGLRITSLIRDAANLLQDGNSGSEVVADLRPRESDHVIVKNQYSAFYGTSLAALLQKLKVTEIVLTGVVSNVCCQATAHDCFFHGYGVVVALDATGAFDEDSHLATMKTISLAYGQVVTTEAIIECLAK